jgi:integrase
MGACWKEIDRENCIWRVPGVRMKAGENHRKPLTPRALAILEEMEVLRRGPFIFPNQTFDGPLGEMALEMLLRRMDAKPITVHGFRTSFRTWVTECTNFSERLAEMGLAHRVGDAVERAYQRGDALEKRREMMEAWQHFIDGAGGENVVQLRKTTNWNEPPLVWQNLGYDIYDMAR